VYVGGNQNHAEMALCAHRVAPGQALAQTWPAKLVFTRFEYQAMPAMTWQSVQVAPEQAETIRVLQRRMI
jgi:chorismate mutase